MAFDNHPVLALIPARGGSKGIPRKNLRLVKGKPLLSYTLEAANSSSNIDTIYLSSDDFEILEFGSLMGAKVIQRPFKFAQDNSTAYDVMTHFIGQLGHDLISQDPYIVYLQPTSPLRNSKHIDNSFTLMKSKSASLLLSVIEMTKSPYKSFTLDKD